MNEIEHEEYIKNFPQTLTLTRLFNKGYILTCNHKYRACLKIDNDLIILKIVDWYISKGFPILDETKNDMLDFYGINRPQNADIVCYFNSNNKEDCDEFQCIG